jgi:Arc/MetJ family transcription regulator
MRTNIVIDDDLMKEAMTLSRLKTKKEVVETGLKLLVQMKKQARIKRLRGKLNWDGGTTRQPRLRIEPDRKIALLNYPSLLFRGRLIRRFHRFHRFF